MIEQKTSRGEIIRRYKDKLQQMEQRRKLYRQRLNQVKMYAKAMNQSTRHPLPSSAFADRIGRRYPIYDKPYTRAAMFWMEQDVKRFMKEPYCEDIHNRIVLAGKKFGIPHRECPLCKGLPEKVIFT